MQCFLIHSLIEFKGFSISYFVCYFESINRLKIHLKAKPDSHLSWDFHIFFVLKGNNEYEKELLTLNGTNIYGIEYKSPKKELLSLQHNKYKSLVKCLWKCRGWYVIMHVSNFVSLVWLDEIVPIQSMPLFKFWNCYRVEGWSWTSY